MSDPEQLAIPDSYLVLNTGERIRFDAPPRSEAMQSRVLHEMYEHGMHRHLEIAHHFARRLDAARAGLVALSKGRHPGVPAGITGGPKVVFQNATCCAIAYEARTVIGTRPTGGPISGVAPIAMCAFSCRNPADPGFGAYSAIERFYFGACERALASGLRLSEAEMAYPFAEHYGKGEPQPEQFPPWVFVAFDPHSAVLFGFTAREIPDLLAAIASYRLRGLAAGTSDLH